MVMKMKMMTTATAMAATGGSAATVEHLGPPGACRVVQRGALSRTVQGDDVEWRRVLRLGPPSRLWGEARRRDCRVVTSRTTEHRLNKLGGPRQDREDIVVDKNSQEEEAYDASLVNQLTAALLVQSTIAPGGRYSNGSAALQPSISMMCLRMVSSLCYLWSLVRVLPAWRRALENVEVHREVDQSKIFGGAMLVAGSTVGAGIVALPVKTAVAGVIPSAACLLGGWGFMLLTALLIVEVSKHCGQGANFTSMAQQTLGRKWKALSAVLYIFVYSATLTAYVAESATFLGPAVSQLFGTSAPNAALSLGFSLTLGTIIGMGSKMVDAANSTCVAVAMAAFAVLLGLGGSSVSTASLMYSNWTAAAKMMPIMVVAFTFHNMIPSLFQYLGSARAVRQALLIGTSLPLVMYLTWEVLILGSLPPGAALGSVSDVMAMIGANGIIMAAINVFSLFAIITSFLGVGLGCIDFLKDLLGHAKDKKPRGWLLVATMGLPSLVACLCPKLFVPALEISGVLRLILFAVIPALMMMKGPLANSKWKGSAVAVTFTALSAMIIGIDVMGRFSLV